MGAVISTHAPRTGSDASSQFCWTYLSISTHAPRTGSDPVEFTAHQDGLISTHAPRTGSDLTARNQRTATGAISTHAPRTGSDHAPCASFCHIEPFQPTLPARGATYVPAFFIFLLGISTHAPRTGSDAHARNGGHHEAISTHAPRTGSDMAFYLCRCNSNDFNPRSPHGERRRST